MNYERMLGVANEFMASVGLEATTVPEVLLRGRVPTTEQSSLLREVEDQLFGLRLVEDVKSKKKVPGGWRRLRLSERGYRLAESRQHIAHALSPEELRYRRFRGYYRKLCRAPEDTLPTDQLGKLTPKRRSRMERDLRHLEQIGWVRLRYAASGERRFVTLTDRADHYYEDYPEGIALVRSRPYRDRRTVPQRLVPPVDQEKDTPFAWWLLLLLAAGAAICLFVLR